MIMHGAFQDMRERIRRADDIVRDYPPGSRGGEELARARDAFSDAMLAAIADDESRAREKLAEASEYLTRATGPGAAGPTVREALADSPRTLLMARGLLMALDEEGFEAPPGDWPELTKVAARYAGRPVPPVAPADFDPLRELTVGQFAMLLTRGKDRPAARHAGGQAHEASRGEGPRHH